MKQFELENLVFRRNARFTLEIDELSLDSGEKVAVVGPNGSGKTTLLRILAFVEEPDSWTRFLFRDEPCAPGKTSREGLGFLKEQPLLFRGTVAENLAYPLKLRRLPRPEIRERVDAMLARMQLERLAGARARHLSAGEQRRLALGRVLIAGPETLLLDEPVAHLDARSRAVIEDVLAAAEVTLLMTTHDVHFAHRMSDRVLNLKRGRIFAGMSVNILEGRVEEGRLLTAGGLRVPLPETAIPTRVGSLTVIVDPRALTVSPDPPRPGSDILVTGHVSSIREHGDEVWMEVDCGHRLTAIVSRTTYEKEGLNLHREVTVSFGLDGVEVL